MRNVDGVEIREDQCNQAERAWVTRPVFKKRKRKTKLEKGLYIPQANGYSTPLFSTWRWAGGKL